MKLYILTGPPGAGKTTYAATLGLDVYDTDLDNKEYWRTSTTDCILCAAAPSRSHKEYWLKEARSYGFTPILITIWVDRMIALLRMEARSGDEKWERNDLQKGIQRWYKTYERHPEEDRITPT